MICGSVVCEGGRYGLVCFAHDALVTSECLLHGLGGRSELREERQSATQCTVARPPLCALHQLLPVLQKHEETEGGAVAAGVVY